MKFKKSLISRKKGFFIPKSVNGQAVIEYIVIFIAIALLAGGFISRGGEILNGHFNTMRNQILR